jgi:drug/metabolite transporter (DMT)-like permease
MVKAFVAAFIGFFYVMITNKRQLKVTKSQIPPMLFVAITGALIADVIYYYALTQIPVLNAVLIGHMQPVFIILIGFFILKGDKLTKFDIIGVIIMIFSGLLVTTRTLENLIILKIGTFGDLVVLCATITWATTAIAMRKYLTGMHAGTITFYRFFIAAVFLVGYLFVHSSVEIPNSYQIVIGLIIGLGTVLYYEGLKRIKAAQVSALELSTPFFAAMLGLFVLGEVITMMQIVGIFLLLFGIYALSKE